MRKKNKKLRESRTNRARKKRGKTRRQPWAEADGSQELLLNKRVAELLSGKWRSRNGSADEKFFEALEVLGNVTVACYLSGLGRSTVYDRIHNDPAFKLRVAEATEAAQDLREYEIDRRAFAGSEEPVWYEGRIVGYVRRPSDTLAIFATKANRPQKFRDKVTVNHEGESRPSDAATLVSAISAFMGAVQPRAAAGAGVSGESGTGKAAGGGAGTQTAGDGRSSQ